MPRPPENENQTMSHARTENAMQDLVALWCRTRTFESSEILLPQSHSKTILIAERTDPGWIVLFTQAKGIIVEYGSLRLTAIVSRELGIPAIVSMA